MDVTNVIFAFNYFLIVDSDHKAFLKLNIAVAVLKPSANCAVPPAAAEG